MNTTLYNKDTTGRVRVWSITVTDKTDYSEISIISGLADGKKVEQVLAIREGKNLGKVNETTHYTQAISEAEARVEQQYRQGYVDDLSQLRDVGTLGSGLRKPMLAVTFDPTGKRPNSKTLEQLGIANKEVGLQAKLDGNRMLVVVSDGRATAYTRKGDIMPVQPTHILLSIEDSYKANGFTDLLVLDGEILHPEMTFNESNGLLKRFKNNLNTDVLEEFVYYIYDTVLDAPYRVRNDVLEVFNDFNSVIQLPTEYVIATNEVLKDRLGKFISEGKEGLIIRNLSLSYEHKRSKGLIKYKEFQDDEFVLVDIEEDRRGGFVGNFVLAMNEPSADKNGKPITEFKAGTTGMSQEQLVEIWEHKEDYIGNKATVEFFELSEFGVPRFGKVKELNRADV